MTTRRVTCRPSWWPCEYPAGMVGQSFVYRMGAERLRLKKPKRIQVSKWAEKYRVVNSSRPGPWRNATTPYLAGIMDAIDHPAVERVAFCKPPQSGGTEAAINYVGSRVDMDPADVLMVYPDDATKTLNLKDRVHDMLSRSPRLSRYLTGDESDVSGGRIRLRHMRIYGASAGSDAQLANKPIKYTVLDEVNKYTQSKTEASSIKLADKRTTSYRGNGRKTIILSTPTVESDAAIWAETQAAQFVFHYWVRCPFCGGWQDMLFDRIRWDGGSDADPEAVKAYDLAWYVCAVEECGRAWTDEDRDEAVRQGEWRADSGGQEEFADKDRSMGDSLGQELFACLDQHQPRSIAFHMPAWVSPFVGLAECAAAFLEGLKDKIKLRDFMNSYRAMPWREVTQDRPESTILALRDDRPRGLVPGGGVVACLTGTVDTQDNGFWYEIRAQGYGWAQETWSVREGFLPVDWSKVALTDMPGRQWPYHPGFDPLREVLWEDEYLDPDGRRYPVQLVLIDAMGHHTTEVYDFCRAHRGQIFACKGELRMNSAIAWTDLETYPGTKKKIPGGLKLLRHNTTYFKDNLSARLSIDPADPGAWRYHSEIDASWARQMTAEYKDEKKGTWECPSGRANHAWDCASLHLVGAEVLRVKMWPRPGEQTQAARPTRKPKPQRVDRGW